MDNPQHYLPLSRALGDPLQSTLNQHGQSHYPPANAAHPSYSESQKQDAQSADAEHDEEDDEEEDDDDEGFVEEQLNQNDVDMHGSDHASPQPSGSTNIHASASAPRPNDDASTGQEQKRRPGRPRGSKNRRPRVAGTSKHDAQFYRPPPIVDAPAAVTATPHHASISPQNQQYYEFQWRVLNLCAEFYGAAEELVKGTSPLVIAQCYSLGPGVKVDPLAMIIEAKRVCDSLLANPSQLVTNPPPQVYPVMPVYPSIAQTNHTPTVPTATAVNPNVITNPQTFVVPLGVQPTYSTYSLYPTSSGAYPATSYYPYYPQAASVHYPPPMQPLTGGPAAAAAPAAAATQSSPPSATSQPTATITTTPATGGTVIGNQGAWSDEETERLKKLTDESKTKGSVPGDIDWDWVKQEWGISRTRHQILIKATAMGLKESSTRGVKRRRDAEGSPMMAPSMTSLHQISSNPNPQQESSPAQSTSQAATSPPTASPAMQNQQRPSSSKSGSTLPWPMPTVAVSTAAPVLATTGNPHEQQRASYYRPRPNQDTAPKPAAQPAVQHQFMYTTPGALASNMRPAENGK